MYEGDWEKRPFSVLGGHGNMKIAYLAVIKWMV